MSDSEKDKTEFPADIKELTNKIQKSFSIGNEDVNWSLLKQYQCHFLMKKNFNQVMVTSYISILSTLLDSLRETLFSQKWQESLFDEFFLQGVHHQAFMILINRLEEKENYQQQKIIKLLVKFTQSSSMESLLMYQCVSHPEWNLKYVSKSNFWDDLTTSIISLPERMANKTRGKFIKIFNPDYYIPLLLSSVFKVLSHIHTRLKNSQDCSLEFLAKLTGRLCVTGNADIVAKKFSKELISVSESDFIWRRISQNFITKMPSSCLDSFIINLLLVIPWYGYVGWILGDAGVKNEKINYIMTVKLLFVHHFKKDIILQNTIGYFANLPDHLSQFSKILNALLDSWIDKRALKCQSIEHKIYIASALMICAGWVKKIKFSFDTKVYIQKVLAGTQLRLDSSEETVRYLGMVVGENLIKSFESDSPPLEFECNNMDLVNYLKRLSEIPPKPDDSSLFFEDLKCFEEIERNIQENISSADQNAEVASETNELDSDDDLEPYDMSNDIMSATKRPLYLRDCMKGLIEHENAEWTEQCLKHAEELIKENPYAVKEIAEEMTKIVLHLDDNFAIPDFLALRHRILITLTVQCPVVVSNYLTSQFSAKDYNIRQRLDILEVLAASSMALSHSGFSDSKPQPLASKEDFIAKRESNWKLIISQRLEAKTKLFTKIQQPILKENKFSALAGNFFYPLLNSYVSNIKVFKLCGEDSYVLGRLIYTLGIIMYAASNTLHCREMGTTLLQFLKIHRSHEDVFVRQSIIFATATTYMAVPFSVLFRDMLQDVLDTNDWLQSIAQNDPERSCVERAIYTLSVFQSVAAEETTLHWGGVPGLNMP